jgi:hypothetical protein
MKAPANAPRAVVILFRLLVLGLCMWFSTMLAGSIRKGAHGGETMMDFGGPYYQAKCAVEHKDPYDPATVLAEFQADGWNLPRGEGRKATVARAVVTMAVYPPTALLMTAPLTAMKWPVARNAWVGLMDALLVVAGLAVWDLAEGAPLLAGGMTGFMLANCVLLLLLGNPAGVVVPLCVMAAWCFVKQRFGAAGVALLAVALVLKPHDAGFVWLYFLLAGGPGRKRALETLGVAAVLGICAAVWMAPISPHWMQEWHSNLAAYAAKGGINDPGPTGMTDRGFGPIVSLQNTISLFWDDPRIYNPLSYVIAGGMILAWGFAALRRRESREGTLLALAAISALTQLPVYHRTHDAKLMMLMIPACAMLWAAKGARRWVALGLTAAAIFVTSDLPLILWAAVTAKLQISAATLGGKLEMLALDPAPVILLAAAGFYLWTYWRHEPRVEAENFQRGAVEVAAVETGR